MKSSYTRLFVVFIFLFSLSCNQIRKVTDIIVQPTARELYAREFQELDTLKLSAWKTTFQKAKQDSLEITLPYVEVGTYYKDRNEVYSYESELEEGSILIVEAKTDVLGTRVFLDIFKKESDSSFTELASNELDKSWLEVPIKENGNYKITIQPELAARGNFTHEVQIEPSFGFPVAGKDNKAIQSYWGATRDGGVRSHEGVDIFADRGTPVVAVTEGRISSTGNRGLGGKQVWLRTGVFGKSIYYAHLDSILTSVGKRVEVGDTLGLVGNTGNARTTKPHLHLGIYESGRGAVNPLPFVKMTEDIPSVSIKDSLPHFTTVKASLANLRNAPKQKGEKIGELNAKDTIQFLGLTDDWAHIKTKADQKAYVHKSLIFIP